MKWLRKRRRSVSLSFAIVLTLIFITVITATTAQAVEVLVQGTPFVPQEDGLFFTETEARTIYRQKLEAELRAELAESSLAKRDEQMNMLYNEFKDYMETSKEKDKLHEQLTKKARNENTTLKVLLGITAVAGIIF